MNTTSKGAPGESRLASQLVDLLQQSGPLTHDNVIYDAHFEKKWIGAVVGARNVLNLGIFAASSSESQWGVLQVLYLRSVRVHWRVDDETIEDVYEQEDV